MKKLTIILLSAIISTLLLQSAAIAQNFTCELLNNQDPIAVCQAQADDPEAECDDTQGLAGKIVIITEEPLGRADGEFTHRCARKTKCGVEVREPTSAPAANGSNESAQSPPTSTSTCVSTYTSVDNCTAEDTENGFVTCEYVMAYVADDGPALLYGYIGQVYQYIAGLGGLIAVFTIIVGGVMIASAGGDSERVTKAKTMIQRSLIGLVVLFLSALILYTINPNFFTL